MIFQKNKKSLSSQIFLVIFKIKALSSKTKKHVFLFQFYIPFSKNGHKKYVHFLIFDLRIGKKNEKNTLEHNALIS